MSEEYIYKYKLEMKEHQVIKSNGNFKPLRVEFQGDQLCVWVINTPLLRYRYFDFYIIGTGQEIDDFNKFIYISTVFKDDFVWHIFYRERF